MQNITFYEDVRSFVVVVDVDVYVIILCQSAIIGPGKKRTYTLFNTFQL